MKIIKSIFIFLLFFKSSYLFANTDDFNIWLSDFKEYPFVICTHLV